VKRALVSAVLLVVACSGAAKDAGTPAMIGESGSGGWEGDLPAEALGLLAKSASDTCAVCAREARQEAFQILAAAFPPGRIVASDSMRWFVALPGGNELLLGPPPAAGPAVTFRFHTAENHLVGIAESDWTDSNLAERIHALPPGSPFHASIEVVPFAYGDGPTFSYSPSAGRVRVHCKVVAIASPR